jgi:hypothetical protein
MEYAYWIGAWSAVACFIVTYAAAGFVSKHSTLYTALALVAVSWALIAAIGAGRLDGIQNADPLTDRAYDVVAFLFVLVGSLMMKAEPEKHPTLQSVQRWMQVLGLLLVSYLVLPERATFIPALLKEWLNTPTKLQLFFGEILGTLGYVSLVLGVYALVGRRWALLFLPVVTAYEALSLWRTSQIWEVRPPAARPHPGPELAYSFVSLRIIFTLFVCAIVLAYVRRSVPDRWVDQTGISVGKHP